MFIDIANISIKSGDGGNGCVSFHREKYVANGGPNGGDGGNGGSIIFVADKHLNTLVDFRYKRKYVAQNGDPGTKKNSSGKSGEDLIIKVPMGTIIKDKTTGQIIKDISDDTPFLLAKGGKGGWGNQHFATPTRQAPRFAKSGLKGIEFDLTLELKLLADVGLLGFPNVGKSTFLSMVSAARPKIANYHFTTLTPNLGVVRISEGQSFVMADIPGIIKGASEGVGLGHAFLRHVDRCRLLVHIVDISGTEGRNPIEDFNAINEELAKYDSNLSSRPQIVVGNKKDIAFDEDLINEFKEYVESKGYEFILMSAATKMGTDEVINKVAAKLATLPEIVKYEPEYVKPLDVSEEDRQTIVYKEDDVFIVEGEWLLKVIGSVNFDDYESLQYFQRVLRKSGVIDMLYEKGVKEGDKVVIYDLEFDFVD